MLRVYSILYTERLWYANRHDIPAVTQPTSDQTFYTSSIADPSQEIYHYEASVEASEHDSSEDEISEMEESHGQISQAVLCVESNQPEEKEEEETIPCRHPHSILEQDIQIETSQQQQQEEDLIQVICNDNIKKEELSIEILPNDEEVVESLTVDTSSLKMPSIEKEEEISLSSSCSTTPPKTPPSSSHHSSTFLHKSKTTTSLFRRETTKLNDRRKSLTKKIKKVLHTNPTKRFSI